MLHLSPVEAILYAMLHSPCQFLVYPVLHCFEAILNALPDPHVRQSLVHLDTLRIRFDDLLIVEQDPLVSVSLPDVRDVMTGVDARALMADECPQAVLRRQTRVPDLLLLRRSRAWGCSRGRPIVVGMREQPFDGALRVTALSIFVSERPHRGSESVKNVPSREEL